MYSIEDIQDAILDLLTAEMAPWKVVEQAVPNTKTVKRDEKGQIVPYVAIQFGDLAEGSTHNMATPLGDDYRIPFYVQAVAPVPDRARKIANKVIRVVLAKDFPWSGSVRKRPGGGMWPIVSSDGATEAYQFPASFSVPVQYHYEP